MESRRTVCLDSSTLVWLKRDFFDIGNRGPLVDALDALHDEGFQIVLTAHQFVELLSHEDYEEARARLDYLRWWSARPGVGWIAAGANRDSLGMIPHVTAVEVSAALDGVPPEDLRSHVLESLLRDSHPPADEFSDLELLHPIFRAQRERALEISSIVMTRGPQRSKETIGDLRKRPARAPIAARRVVRAEQASMTEELRRSGDRRLKDPERTASSFLSSAANDIPLQLRPDDTAIDAIIRSAGLDPSRIPDEMLFHDLAYYAEFMKKARLAIEFAGDTGADLADLELEQVPTVFIQYQLRLARVKSGARARGGDLTDGYLASLCNYLDVVIADKQTTELMRQVRGAIGDDRLGDVRRVPPEAGLPELAAVLRSTR